MYTYIIDRNVFHYRQAKLEFSNVADTKLNIEDSKFNVADTKYNVVKTDPSFIKSDTQTTNCVVKRTPLPVTCPQCDNQYTVCQDLVDHVARDHPPPSPYINCPHCKATCMPMYKFMKHMKDKHMLDSQRTNASPGYNEYKDSQCPYCQGLLWCDAYLKAHIFAEHTAKAAYTTPTRKCYPVEGRRHKLRAILPATTKRKADVSGLIASQPMKKTCTGINATVTSGLTTETLTTITFTERKPNQTPIILTSGISTQAPITFTQGIPTQVQGTLKQRILTPARGTLTQRIPTPAQGTLKQRILTPARGTLTQRIPTPAQGTLKQRILTPARGTLTQRILTPARGTLTQRILTPAQGTLKQRIPTPAQGTLTQRIPTPAQGTLTQRIHVPAQGTLTHDLPAQGLISLLPPAAITTNVQYMINPATTVPLTEPVQVFYNVNPTIDAYIKSSAFVSDMAAIQAEERDLPGPNPPTVLNMDSSQGIQPPGGDSQTTKTPLDKGGTTEVVQQPARVVYPSMEVVYTPIVIKPEM